jgi:hypothetical protein
LDSLQKTRWVAVVATLIVIPCGAVALRFIGRQDRNAGIATASAAAAAHDCKLGRADILRLVEQYGAHYDVGWAESGSAVAKNIGKDCGGSGAVALPSS